MDAKEQIKELIEEFLRFAMDKYDLQLISEAPVGPAWKRPTTNQIIDHFLEGD